MFNSSSSSYFRIEFQNLLWLVFYFIISFAWSGLHSLISLPSLLVGFFYFIFSIISFYVGFIWNSTLIFFSIDSSQSHNLACMFIILTLVGWDRFSLLLPSSSSSSFLFSPFFLIWLAWILACNLFRFNNRFFLGFHSSFLFKLAHFFFRYLFFYFMIKLYQLFWQNQVLSRLFFYFFKTCLCYLGFF